MKNHIEPGAVQIVLRKAILLYGASDSPDDASAYASFHDVMDTGTPKRPNVQIMAAEPLTQDALMQTLGALADRYAISTDLLPENVLSHSPMHLIWWLAPGKRRVFLNTKDDGAQAAIVPHPALLFAVVQGRWYVYAMKDSTRPNKSTQLFHSAFLNIYDNGSVCTGSANTPKSMSASKTTAWEDAFFDSVFTHVNGKSKVVSKGGEKALWRELMAGKHEQFPLSSLKKSDFNLGSLMAELLTFQVPK